ncbi:MAG: hypothetical protein HDT09_00175 [Bacteroidales bacterium]|nr:hypothetical protein [Bacteroidales bacterium]
MSKGLNEALELMARGREFLINSYIEKNSDRYRYSFQYNSSPVALEIAGDLMDHQWLDKQLLDAHDKFEHNDISNCGLELFVHTIQKFSILHSDKVLFVGYDSLLDSKIKGLKVLLSGSDRMNQKIRALEFDYFRDKVLFEREMKKYSEEINQSLK